MESKQSSVNKILESSRFNFGVTLIIIYSVICYSLDTLPNNDQELISFLHYSEFAVVTLFTVEYLCRIYAAENRIKFIFSFYGLIDLLAILPFYLATAIDLRALRLLRLMRLLRLLKLARYNKAVGRFVKALYLSKDELVVFLLASFIMFYLAAFGIYHFENSAQPEVFRSIFDSLWWAVATLTTVGYGDIYPITTGGRIFTFFILMIGLGLIAVPTGIVASALSEVRKVNNSD